MHYTQPGNKSSNCDATSQVRVDVAELAYGNTAVVAGEERALPRQTRSHLLSAAGDVRAVKEFSWALAFAFTTPKCVGVHGFFLLLRGVGSAVAKRGARIPRAACSRERHALILVSAKYQTDARRKKLALHMKARVTFLPGNQGYIHASSS